MDILHTIAERRIQEAIAAGWLDEFAGQGEPIELDDLSRVPSELRAGYMLLKSHGFLPEELELRKEVLALGDLVRACADDGARRELVERRNASALRLALCLERRGVGAAWSDYAASIADRLAPER
jgi:hypothetical protein